MSNAKRTKKTPYRTGERALTQREYQRLLTVCNTLEEEVILKLAVALGLRRADLAALKRADIDTQAGTLIYYEHKKRRSRNVPMGQGLCQLLRKYDNTLPRGQEYLFRWGSSTWGDRTAHRRLQDLCDRAGVDRRPFHALRGTCIKFKQAAGWPPEATAKLIGDTLRVVQEHYAVPSDAEIAELMREKETV